MVQGVENRPPVFWPAFPAGVPSFPGGQTPYPPRIFNPSSASKKYRCVVHNAQLAMHLVECIWKFYCTITVIKNKQNYMLIN